MRRRRRSAARERVVCGCVAEGGGGDGRGTKGGGGAMAEGRVAAAVQRHTRTRPVALWLMAAAVLKVEDDKANGTAAVIVLSIGQLRCRFESIDLCLHLIAT